MSPKLPTLCWEGRAYSFTQQNNYRPLTANNIRSPMNTYSKPYSTATRDTISFTENTNKKSINSAVTRRDKDGIRHSRPIHKQTCILRVKSKSA